MEDEWIKFRGKISTNGRVTIPIKVRESENLKTGEYLDVKIKKVDEK